MKKTKKDFYCLFHLYNIIKPNSNRVIPENVIYYNYYNFFLLLFNVLIENEISKRVKKDNCIRFNAF